MEILKKHFDLLGYEVIDQVTGYAGVATSLSFDLYGCIQLIVSQKMGDDGVIKNGSWFDISRLKKTSTKRVMEIPNFSFGEVARGEKGGAEKPSQ